MAETTYPSPRDTGCNRSEAPAAASMRHLVMIDDDAECLAAVTELLAMFGYKVSGFSEPRAALAHLHQASALPEGILLDERMPGMRGSEFLAQRAQEPRLRGIPVIVVSAEDDGDEGEERWRRIGATGRVVKPLTLDDLLGALSRALPPTSSAD